MLCPMIADTGNYSGRFGRLANNAYASSGRHNPRQNDGYGYLGRVRGIYTANHTIQVLRAIFNKVRCWKLFLKDNPAAGISLFPEKARERLPNKEEIRRLIQALLMEKDHGCDVLRLQRTT